MEILHFDDLGIQVSFGCERSCSSPRRVSNFNSKDPHVGIYPHIKLERDALNTFRVRVFTSYTAPPPPHSHSCIICFIQSLVMPRTISEMLCQIES